jgi:hypothetical protein
MEPHREKPRTAKVRPEEKRKRFRVLKLEERITPRHQVQSRGTDCFTSGTASIE